MLVLVLVVGPIESLLAVRGCNTIGHNVCSLINVQRQYCGGNDFLVVVVVVEGDFGLVFFDLVVVVVVVIVLVVTVFTGGTRVSCTCSRTTRPSLSFLLLVTGHAVWCGDPIM